ncbi:MAG: hypothetical protein ACYCO9_22015 [Streptosporangiaceae bacterium]
MTATRSERVENTVQLTILLLIGGMAGAASFTHVHDWTMHNVPPGTGSWLGWANAVISELTPTAAGLEIRRRKRQHRPIAYPLTVLIAAATLSLTAQVAQATHSPTGWLVAAIPALAFLALSKLVLSRTSTQPHDDPAASAGTMPGTTAPDEREPVVGTIPPELLTGARMAAFTHRQATGSDITADHLATHLSIPHDLAGSLIRALGDDGIPVTSSPAVITHVNGTQPAGSRR